MKPYDPQNIFARILKGELTCKKVYEDDFALAFRDHSPRADIHVLLIPKGPYTCASDFYSHAPPSLIIGFARALAHVTHLLGIQEEGFRLISNEGTIGGQEVPHFHIHVLSAKSLGPMLTPS